MNATESRSGASLGNLQETLDADGSSTLEQYLTPVSLARELAGLLPTQNPPTVLDPQCGSGNLLNVYNYATWKFGIELDDAKEPANIHLVHANCVKIFEAIEQLLPSLQFAVANANPPFGRHWKLSDGTRIDSTLATWNFVTRHAGCGYFIANANTVEKFGLHESTEAVRILQYERRQACQYWDGLRPELQIGIVIWERRDRLASQVTPGCDVNEFWKKLVSIMDEERTSRPPYNIWLDRKGFLETYLSQRTTYQHKLTDFQIQRLHRIKGSHPLALTPEKETRELLRELIDCGLYTISPEAEKAIKEALLDVNRLAVPIMPVNSFELVAYTDEEETLVCRRTCTRINGQDIRFTAGKSYKLSTGSYKFSEAFKRDKVHFDEKTRYTYTKKHDCVLSGSDRYISVTDDDGSVVKFLDRPRQCFKTELPEALLWDYFKKPVVETVAEQCRQQVETNLAVLKACEMLAGYEYFPGQLEYLARVASKDRALIAAETGTGKSLFAISMLALKSPKRALLIAPQGTMRASRVEEDEDEDENTPPEMSASQWVKELHKFAPYIQVWEIFKYEDYEQILALNGGKLPYGLFVTYYEAFFQNGGKEQAPPSWDDEKLNKYLKAKELPELPVQKSTLGIVNKRFWCNSIGREVEGVRCVLEPCLSTLIGHEFDCVIVDESHRAKGIDTITCQMLIRLQPKFRYCLTATPVSNIVTDLFPIIGWLACEDWYKGDRRNAAWPFARDEIGKFEANFLTQERDLTQEEDNKMADPGYTGKVIKKSPIISAPARLLKLLKPNMAFISKEQCRPDYIKPKITDVRVPLGRDQAVLYGFFCDRANIPATNPLVRARKQTAYLRNICADPAGFSHGGPKVLSNFNPKVVAILELTRDILARGEQVVIINSRVGLTSTIISKLAEAGVPVGRIDSTMTAEQHTYQSNLFKAGKTRVLGMGIKCAAAYSFDACDNLIIGSLEYSCGTFVQACGRIDRITNRKVKNIYCILHKNSLEEVQWETVSMKNDAANLCLRGIRIARDFVPVDGAEILARALDRFDLSGATPETECEAQWPKLARSIGLTVGYKF